MVADGSVSAGSQLLRPVAALARVDELYARGVAERDAGRVGASMRMLRRALRLSREAGLVERAGDLAASLAVALAMAGRRGAAMSAFDDALATASGQMAGRILVRRSGVLGLFGDFAGAHADADAAVALLDGAGEGIWTARAHSNVAFALRGLGRFAEADEHYVVGQRLAERDGHPFDATVMLHNRGDCAHRLGELPRALQMLYAARERYEQLGVVPPEVVRDLVVVQLAAGLTEEAAASADELVAILRADRDAALRRADGLVAAASAHLAAGDPARAADLAGRAARSSRRQGHAEAERHARIVVLRAQAAAGKITARQARAAAELAGELRDRHSSERLDAQVLAGRMALSAGLPELAAANLSAAAAQRHQGSALRRASAWYAAALLAGANGERGAMLRACERGLDILDAHALSLGATELRARATVHGTDLAALATRRVAFDGTARELLRWSERWRGALHALPWPQARRDAVLAAELGKLRAVERELGSAPDSRHEAERRRIEERIRRHVHGRAGDATRARRRFAVADLLDALGETTLVSVIGVKGERFHVLVVRRGRVRQLVAGRVDEVSAEVEYARFALRAAAQAPEPAAEALLAGLEPALTRLDETLLGPAAALLDGEPVVLVPPSTLQAAPWGALPSLRSRTVTVAPSAAAWLRARATVPPPDRRTALVAGKDLASSGAEVTALAETYPKAAVLTGDDATAGATMDVIDGTWLAHIGAHGRYRGDNPMFSSLDLADGPVTVYDFEGLVRAPYRLVLTACESGVGSPTGADELLGLTTSLSALGTAGLLASVVPVNDEGSVGFSLLVHDRLRAGDDFATALLAARRAADGAVATATAWSFVALGAA